MDLQISKWVIKVFGENKGFAQFMKIITYGGSKWVVIGLVLLLLLFRRTRRIGIKALFATLITFLLNDFVIKVLVARNRPFVDDESLGQMCVLAGLKFPDGYSMTSGHAAVTMAFAVVVMMSSWKLGIPAMLYSLLVGMSRIFLCVHYFTDVLAGFALGTVIAIIVYYAVYLIIKLRRMRKRRKQNEKASAGVSEQTQDSGDSVNTEQV